MVQIKGIATISDNGFLFQSGLPTDTSVISPQRMHGTLSVCPNADVAFRHRPCISLPPEVHAVGEGENYRIKRTSRNYIIQIKVPIVENRRESERNIRSVLPEIMGDITLDRKEILSPVIRP